MLYALQWHDTQTNERATCEVEGDVCYEVSRTAVEAEERADFLNKEARHNGWSSRYSVIELPHGLRPYFSGEEPEPAYFG